MCQNLLKICMFFFVLYQYNYCFESKTINVGVITEKDDLTTFPVIKTVFDIPPERNYKSYVGYVINLINEKVDFNDLSQLDQAVCRLLKGGIYALFANPNTRAYQTLATFVNHFNITLFVPSLPEISPDLMSRFMVSMQPQTVRAIIDILRHYRQESIFYLYDSNNGLGKLQMIFQLGYKAHPINLAGLLKVSNAEQVNKYLRKLQNSDKHGKFYVVLDTDLPLTKDILVRHAHDIHVGKTNFHFLLANPVLEEFWKTAELTSINVTGFVTLPPNSKFPFKIWNDQNQILDIPMSAYFFYDAAMVLIENIISFVSGVPPTSLASRTPYRRPLIDQTGNCFDESSISKLNYRIFINDLIQRANPKNTLTGKVTFNTQNVRNNLSITIIESSSEGYKKTLYWFGVLRKFNTPILTEATAFPRIQDEKRKFKIISVLSPSFLMLQSSKNGTKFDGNDRYKGFVKDLVELLSKRLNFDYEIVLSEDKMYGVYDESTGQWKGMIGDIIRGKADMAVADLQITVPRQKVVDFLNEPIGSTSLTILLKNPRSLTLTSSSPFYLFSSFSVGLWICIIIFAIIITVLFHVMSNFTGSPDNIEATSGIWGKKFTIMSSIWFICGSSVMHDTGIYPRSLSSRVLGSSWWCFTLVCLAFLIANTTTRNYMDNTNTEHHPQLNRLMSLSVESIVKESIQNNWPRLDILRRGSTHKYIKRSILPTNKMLADYFKYYSDYLVDNVNSGIQKVRDSKGKYAFVTESSIGNYYSNEGPCDTVSIHDTLPYAEYGIAVPLGSYIRYDLNAALKSIKDTGELGHLHRKWWADELKCDSRSQITYDHQSLAATSGIFYISLIAVIIAGLVCLAQYFWQAHKKEERRQRLSFEEVTMNQNMQNLPLPPMELLTDSPVEEDNGIIDGWAERKLIPTSFSKESPHSNQES